MVLEVKRIPTQAKANLEKAIKSLQNKVAKVGWVEKKFYPYKASSMPIQPTTVAEVAYLNEKGMYARPFMRPTITKQETNWRKICFNKSKQVINGKATAFDVMEAVGSKASGDISKTIKQIWSPPLKPSTIQARINRYSNDSDLKLSTRKRRKAQLKKFVPSGLYKPLIDTSLMFSTLTYAVEDEK